VAFLWAGVVNGVARKRGVGAEPSSSQLAEAAGEAYGMMSAFASEFAALLGGLAVAPQQHAGMLAYLQANGMHACQRLLAASTCGLGADADAAVAPIKPPSQQQAAANKLQPLTTAAPAAVGGRRLRAMDVLMGFGDGQQEAAFEVSKAIRMEQADAWTTAATLVCAAMGFIKLWAGVSASQDERAWVFLACTVVWWVWVIVVPAAVWAAARTTYLRRRGWIWGTSLLLAGVSGAAIIQALLGDRAAALSRAMISRCTPMAVIEFVARPALLRLSVRQQVLASLGSALSMFYASQGPADGPYSAATCLALACCAVAIAAALDASARRSWLAGEGHAPAAAAPAAAGPARASRHPTVPCTATD